MNPVDVKPCRTGCCGRGTCQGVGNFPGPTLTAQQMKPSLSDLYPSSKNGKCTLLESSREPQKRGFSGAAEESTLMADTGQTSPPPQND